MSVSDTAAPEQSKRAAPSPSCAPTHHRAGARRQARRRFAHPGARDVPVARLKARPNSRPTDAFDELPATEAPAEGAEHADGVNSQAHTPTRSRRLRTLSSKA